MFHLDRVARRFGPTVALHPTTLDIPSARTTVLIGPSGCGKSTLLRLLCGLVRPDAGTITVDGDPFDAAAVRRRLGYVIQDGGLFPHLTGRANVTLQSAHQRRDPEAIADRTTTLCKLTRLSPATLDRYPAQMSGGQRQRVALIRALMPDPDLLLLDEPLGALDPLVRADLQDDLLAIFTAQPRKTVVVVTHDLPEATLFADTLVVMRDGHVVQAGPPAEVVNHPADEFVQRFVTAQRRPLERMGVGA